MRVIGRPISTTRREALIQRVPRLGSRLIQGRRLSHLAIQAFPRIAVRSALLRVEADEVTVASAAARLRNHPVVTHVFAAPKIVTAVGCGDPAIGTAPDVTKAIDADEYHRAGMDGNGVTVAVVDTGINLRFLRERHGLSPMLDTDWSVKPPGLDAEPGGAAPGHGTMCAFDVGIAAPQARLADCPVLLSHAPDLDGWLDDALDVYTDLASKLEREPDHALVVTNSWCTVDPDGDLPPGDEGNYSDNPDHPFNLAVRRLEGLGADILFAAGNCGSECPDRGCRYQTKPINGANAHPQVLTVGAGTYDGRPIGYSSEGPGRIEEQKPDVLAPAHFEGSLVYPDRGDAGTSAACPVVAGIVAAVRSRVPASQLSPAALREIFRKTAKGTGWKAETGYGSIDAAALRQAVLAATTSPS